MSKSYRCVALLTGVIALAAVAGPALAQTPYTVTGVVTDMKNQALANVRVELHRNGALVDSAQTSGDGRYEISFPNGTPIDLKFIESGHDEASFIGLAGTSSQVINKALFKKGEGPSTAGAAPAPQASEQLPNAKTGQCYAQVLVPATYDNKQLKFVKQDAGEKIQIIPAQYKQMEEKVLVEPETVRVNVIPAKFKAENHKVLLRPERTKLIAVPAVYDLVKEKVLVKPATKAWKKGRGPIERIDNATGEIMCLVEIPAQYATVEKRVLKTPATTRTEKIPAVYKTIKRTVMVQDTKLVKKTYAAKYETVKVWKELEPAREKRVSIPAEVTMVTQPVKVTEESIEWREILCETNTTPEIVKRIQQALQKAGYDPGRIDGRLGAGTISAVRAYQKRKGLAEGAITMKTLQSLGVSVGSG